MKMLRSLFLYLCKSKRDRYIADSSVIITDAKLKPYIRYLLWLLDLKDLQPEFYRFIDRISAIKKHNGPQGLVTYLKEANLASMKAIAKEKYIVAPTRVGYRSLRVAVHYTACFAKALLEKFNCYPASGDEACHPFCSKSI